MTFPIKTVTLPTMFELVGDPHDVWQLAEAEDLLRARVRALAGPYAPIKVEHARQDYTGFGVVFAQGFTWRVALPTRQGRFPDSSMLESSQT